MNSPGNHRPSYEELEVENARLRRRVAELEATVADLRRQVEEVTRAGKRQAAPFSKGSPKENPKRPGRKAGHPSSHRDPPALIDRIEDVPLPFHICPDCGGPIEEIEVQPQYQTDIPPIRPTTTRFDIHIGRCVECGHRVQGRHPEQTSDAVGAAAVQVGPQALGMACEMKHRLGLSYGKLATYFSSVMHLPLSRATFARADLRLAQLFAPTYAQLILRLRESEVAHVDETGWKIAGHRAWLWVFTQTEVTLYVIDPHRGHEVAERILGDDFDGMVVCDCLLTYDAVKARQQKCLAHLVHRASQLEQQQTKGAVRFPRAVLKLLRAGIRLKQRKTTMSEHGYRVACGRLEAAMDRLLQGNYTQEDNARLAKLLRKHRTRLFPFLYHEAVDATNNAAERALRPAVISRKLSAGNRSDAGAQAHAILASVIQTCRQKGHDFQAWVKKLLCDPNPEVPDWAFPPQPP